MEVLIGGEEGPDEAGTLPRFEGFEKGVLTEFKCVEIFQVPSPVPILLLVGGPGDSLGSGRVSSCEITREYSSGVFGQMQKPWGSFMGAIERRWVRKAALRW